MVGNVSLNNKLARVKPDSADAASPWQRYLSDWTAWNHVGKTANAKQSPMTIAANNPDHLQHVKRP